MLVKRLLNETVDVYWISVPGAKLAVLTQIPYQKVLNLDYSHKNYQPSPDFMIHTISHLSVDTDPLLSANGGGVWILAIADWRGELALTTSCQSRHVRWHLTLVGRSTPVTWVNHLTFHCRHRLQLCMLATGCLHCSLPKQALFCSEAELLRPGACR